jgi:hypothetical protein
MNTYKFAVYVGPTQVSLLAERFRSAGVEVTCEGTERVHVMEDGDTVMEAREMFLGLLRGAYGHTFCLTYRDVMFVREVK